MPPKTLTEDEMYAAITASDASYNGRFVTGVLTTGIFCLPSCHARKPKRENVRFFSSFEDARGAGLRACMKCKPEEFERGEDRELELLEAAISALRAGPAKFAGVSALAERCGWGTTKLQEGVRRHWQTTPAELIADARVADSKNRLCGTDEPVTAIAFDVGYESLSGFNTAFRERTGMTPTSYRALKGSPCFRLQLPDGMNLEPLRSRLGRDAEGTIESFDGETARRALHIHAVPAILEIKLGDEIEVQVRSNSPVDMRETHAMVVRMIGLDQDPRAFESHCVRVGQTALCDGRLGARIPQTPTLFDGIIWAVVGQQVNLTFARTMRRRLAEFFGDEIGGMMTLPSRERMAALSPKDLLPLQFSRRKAEYLIGLAQASETGFEELRSQAATRVEPFLMSQRGLGVWSTNYLMMRALGFADCVPLGDTGLASGLRNLFSLESGPRAPQQADLMAAFSPYRSLATFHLWQSLKDSA